MAVATHEPQAGETLEELPRGEDSTRIREKDTRLFGHEYGDTFIQPCADGGGQAGSPQVVQCNRLLSDTRGIEIGDLEGLAWDLKCVGEYIRRADCLDARVVVAIAV